MLVAYGMESTYVQTTVDYLKALKTTIGYDVEFIHVTQDARMGIDFDGFDILFQNYCARFAVEGCVGDSYRDALRRFRGLKVISLQDEYEATNRVKSALKEFDFDVVLTCVPESSREYVYPKAEFPNTTFLSVLTGYVPEKFITSVPEAKPLADRPIYLGYRARELSPLYGRLGFEKAEIGRRMKDICDAKGIATDIAVGEGGRFNGEAWLEFVGNCRAMLGTESGSNVFDFDGALAATYRSIVRASGGRSPTYDEFRPYIAERESHIEMGQISPRVFECAIMRTPMVLFRGAYSGCIEADVHYIPLEKDFSNVDRVLERVQDIRELEKVSASAHADLVASGKFGYREFGRMLKGVFDQRLSAKSSQEPALSVRDEAHIPGAECPTAWPQSWHKFKTQQLRSRGIVSFEDALRLSNIYSRAMKADLRAAQRYLNILFHLEGARANEEAKIAAAEFEQLVIRAEAAESVRRLSSLTADRGNRTSQQESGDWIGEYANIYSAFKSTLEDTLKKWDNAIQREFQYLGFWKRPLKAMYIRFSLLRVKVTGSKLEFAKRQLRKSSFFRRFVTLSVNVFGRR